LNENKDLAEFNYLSLSIRFSKLEDLELYSDESCSIAQGKGSIMIGIRTLREYDKIVIQ
jgi:hypothetical protein